MPDELSMLYLVRIVFFLNFIALTPNFLMAHCYCLWCGGQAWSTNLIATLFWYFMCFLTSLLVMLHIVTESDKECQADCRREHVWDFVNHYFSPNPLNVQSLLCLFSWAHSFVLLLLFFVFNSSYSLWNLTRLIWLGSILGRMLISRKHVWHLEFRLIMKTVEECCIFKTAMKIYQMIGLMIGGLNENSGKSPGHEDILKKICHFGALKISLLGLMPC